MVCYVLSARPPKAMERRAKADGVLTWGEREAISGAQREAGRHIYRESHDGNVSRWRLWRRHNVEEVGVLENMIPLIYPQEELTEGEQSCTHLLPVTARVTASAHS
jgi:hypothetical protein